MPLTWLHLLGLVISPIAIAIGITDVRGEQTEPAPLPRPAVSLDISDNATLAHLERFHALLDEKQWQEAIETIRRIAETNAEQLVLVTRSDTASPAGFRRYLSLPVYCQMKLVELAGRSPEALALYRAQIDPVASRLLESAGASPREGALVELVTKYFSSSHADEALSQLGAIALERGQWTEARGYWEQMSPLLRFPAHNDPRFSEFAGQPRWLITRHLVSDDDWQQTLPLLQSDDGHPNWLAYRDPDRNLAEVNARLALVSILEGNQPRARAEIELLRRLFPDASGEIGGQTGNYAGLLQKLLDESQTWPAITRENSWPTFAGSSDRQRIAAFKPGVQSLEDRGSRSSVAPRWQLALPMHSGEGELMGSGGLRVAEPATGLLSYHPVVIGETLVVQAGAAETEIVARRIDDGTVVFGVDQLPAGTVAAPGLKRSVGVPRFPLSSYGNTVYARVGSLPTGTNVDLRQDREEPASIIGLDLESEGRLTVELRLEGTPWGDEWALDGVPVSDGQSLYIALRHRTSVRTESYAACFDARTGRLRWRKFLVGAESAGAERSFELTHTLLTLRHKMLYCNTHLGVVAALNANDGSVRWMTEYPRVDFQNANPDRNTQHLFRDLTPCLLYRDLVITAPMDCNRIFALDANTGILIWASAAEQAADAVHLLGVGQEHLIVSGDYLVWFDAYTGRLVSQFPAPQRSLPGLAKPSPHGFGRGILADKHVYWPTADSILVFDQRIRPEMAGRPPEFVHKIDLASGGLTGGNLVIADRYLVIATPDRLIVFDLDGTPHDHGQTDHGNR